jgi:hypothetical protein
MKTAAINIRMLAAVAGSCSFFLKNIFIIFPDKKNKKSDHKWHIFLMKFISFRPQSSKWR